MQRQGRRKSSPSARSHGGAQHQLTPLLSSLDSLAEARAEWLESDGVGGFASSTISGIRTRRYHAVLLAALAPPAGRVVLVNGFDAWLETPAGNLPLSSQYYAPSVVHPDGATRIAAFEPDPWPTWHYQLDDGTRIVHELFVHHGLPLVVLRWRLHGPRQSPKKLLKKTAGGSGFGAVGSGQSVVSDRDDAQSPQPRTPNPEQAGVFQQPIVLAVRPLLSGRDYHALHRENPAFRFDAALDGEEVTWRPYDGLPAIVCRANGRYTHEPVWYRNFLYEAERQRGLDHLEDLASPGIFRWDLGRDQAVWIVRPEGHDLPAALARRPAHEQAQQLARDEQRRRARLPDRLARSADAYVVRRGSGRTLVAGYPWFTDWGRDTFIALRGLCLATGRLETARRILVEWAGQVSEGMLPNRFPDQGEPEYNSVDASLWYIIAVHALLESADRAGHRMPARDRLRLLDAIEAILSGYANGTRCRIQLDEDGLLAAGEPGVALTWMDARTDGRAVTPRIGKPVEVQALWLNALWIGSRFSHRWELLFEHGRETFQARFWHEAGGYLYDVIDVEHESGRLDAALRPNQIFAVGGLPIALATGAKARRVVDAVEARLITPLGPRSLAPGEPGYAPRYAGSPAERDSAYHQGAVWPWLMGPFVEAWVRVRGNSETAKREARKKFLEPLLAHLHEYGLGHLPEVADGDAPHAPGGCPFQAWSLGEALRLDRIVLARRSRQITKHQAPMTN